MPLEGGRWDLLGELLAVESGIDPRRHDFYLQNYDAPAIRSVVVERPGRLRRDPGTGAPIFQTMTIRAFFKSLGVAALFRKDDPACLVPMQYRAVNGLGFFGYQFGEAALMELGVYAPPRRHVSGKTGAGDAPCYYLGGIDPSAWKGTCRTHFVDRGPSGGQVLATDVNTWAGRFTGRHGAASLSACCRSAVQNRLMTALIRANLDTLSARLTASGASLSEGLSLRGLDMSGTVAAAHLCGPDAVARYLLDGTTAVDEFGTSLRDYALRFADLHVPPPFCESL